MKKRNLVLGMMVGVLSMIGTQATQAVMPGHLTTCTCEDCYVFDALLGDWYGDMTTGIVESWKDAMVDEFNKPQNFHDPNSSFYISPEEERYIPKSADYNKMHRAYNNTTAQVNYIAHPEMVEDGWTSNISAFWSVFDTAYITNNIDKLPSWAGWYPMSMYGAERLFEQNGIYTRTVELKDMMHIYEALSINDSTLMVMDIDPAFLSEEWQEILLSDYPDYYKGGVSTVVIYEISYDEGSDSLSIGFMDPYAVNMPKRYLPQHEFRNATIGAGLHDMIVIDTAQDLN